MGGQGKARYQQVGDEQDSAKARKGWAGSVSSHRRDGRCFEKAERTTIRRWYFVQYNTSSSCWNGRGRQGECVLAPDQEEYCAVSTALEWMRRQIAGKPMSRGDGRCDLANKLGRMGEGEGEGGAAEEIGQAVRCGRWCRCCSVEVQSLMT